MRRNRMLWTVVAGLVLAGMGNGFALAADRTEVPGKISAVTVYRGQALVTREIDVPGPAGLKEIVVTNLPDQVEPGSIYAENADGVQVQSVNYSVHPVEKDVRDAVQKLDEQIRGLQDKLTANQQKQRVLSSQGDYLSKLEQFSASTSTLELSKGVLNADTLQKLTQFIFTERSRISDEGLKATMEQRDLSEQLQMLQAQRGQVAGSSSKLAREAQVFVNLTGGGGKMRVRYIVDNATWQPSYNVRADADRKGFAVEYLASIQQMTGEDWNNVQMSLSTATPSLVAKAPVLTELAITSSRPGQTGTKDVLAQIEQSGGSDQARQELLQQRSQLENFRSTIGANSAYNNGGNPGQPQQQGANGPAGQAANTFNINGNIVNLDYIGDNNDLDVVLNRTAADLQLVDLLARERIARTPVSKRLPLSPDEMMAITYQLKPTNLPSRSDRQLVQITTIPMKAQFYKVASPVLSTFVYDEASAVNDSSTVLLDGEVLTYVNNEFVGRGVMPSVAAGQRFSVGFGIDSSLRAQRVLAEKTESTQVANRVVEFTYRLSVENFGVSPVTVRLLDRLPTAQESEIRVTMSPMPDGQKLSTDPAYELTDKKKGILRWDVDVPGQAVDGGAKSVEYQFKLEYANNVSIGTPVPQPAANPNGGGGRGGFGGGGGGFGGAGGRGGR